MNTFQKGNLAESAIIKTALSKGYVVSVPFGDGSRYDLILDIQGELKKVQVKMGCLSKDQSYISFNTCSNNKGYNRQGYHGEVDFIAVYNPDFDSCYLIPIEETGVSNMKLRLTAPNNNQSKGINFAETYKF